MIQDLTIEGLSGNASALFPHYHAFDSIDSTNAWLLNHKIPGSICIAKEQTVGKGTKGRQWYSEASGNLYFSFSLIHQFKGNNKNLPPLSLLAGLACCEALEWLGMQGQGIKWPNDIYCNNKKLAGVLVEASYRNSYWVIGVGMNVQTAPAILNGQEATYINEYLDVPVTAGQIASAILNSFTTLYSDPENWFDKWAKWDILKGQDILLVTSKHQTNAKIQGLNSQGELMVEIEGELKAISSGEVSIREFTQKDA
ncbi:MAG: Biotin operon represssor [uncultured Thiotrichaceae bacterium]|uniref:biotin--[biotin carboxyl-carrier protein] ligase n=1 Tax=uncultured Thiotrichaceae bacterium TaxID=298394 RepID=A0A6S6UG75_9GAMM|nr:MAG: Biotin operon represssor [uncultured Thiotrichaceae bacterium]